jgi:hypothetical protein
MNREDWMKLLTRVRVHTGLCDDDNDDDDDDEPMISFLLYQELFSKSFHCTAYRQSGARGSVVVRALCYKPEGRGFDTR